MIIMTIVSCIIGGLLGVGYGYIFIRRVTTKISQTQGVLKNRLVHTGLFMSLYMVLAGVFYVLSTTWHINLVVTLPSFLLTFWLIIVSNIRKLSV